MRSKDKLQALEAIRKKHGGVLRAKDVVAAARSRSHPLHGEFEWDNGKAAEAHRIWQARCLITNVYVQVRGASDGDLVPVRYFVSMKDDRKKDGGGYRVLVEMMNEAENRKRVLREALEELAVFERKYEHLKELAPVFAARRKVEMEMG